jgi:alpha-beta hydrolase superfamily lysophospholipase
MSSVLSDTAATLPDFITTRDGIKLALSHWPTAMRPSLKGVVCIVHGLGEHSGRYQGLVRHLNQWGWSVVGFDHRGHGRSTGPRGGMHEDDDLLVDLAQVIDTLRTAYPREKLVLLGHSMGGLIASRFVAALAEPQEDVAWRRQVDLCVLSSAALDIGLTTIKRLMLDSVGRVTPDVAVGNGLKPEWLCSDPDVVKAYVNDPFVHDRISGRLTRFIVEGGQVVLERAPHWSVPTLVQYAGADRCVRPAGSTRFAAALPLHLGTEHHYEHMLHEIYLEPDRTRVIADLQGWLLQH